MSNIGFTHSGHMLELRVLGGAKSSRRPVGTKSWGEFMGGMHENIGKYMKMFGAYKKI